MKKILYIVSTLKRSGPTNQLFNIIKNLDSSLFEAHLITLSPETSDSRWADYEVLGVRMQSLELTRLKGLFFAKYKLNKLVEGISPDLIHSQGARADVFSAGLSNIKAPKICTVRNFPQLDYKMTYGNILGLYLTYTQTRAFRALDLCCCVSDAVANNLRTEFSVNNTKTVRNGVDDLLFSKVSHEEKKSIRARLSLPGDAVIWLSSIGKDLRKNSDFIVKEFISFLEANPNHMLVFIGDGELRQICENLAHHSSQVCFFGRTQDVKSFLQAADYFVSASKAEGMPNAVLEAMACGLPTFLSDIEPHVEVKTISPASTFLFSLNGKGGLSKQLLDCDFNNYKAQSNNAHVAVKEQLSSTIMSKSYQQTYKQLLSLGEE
ncbi:MAG: glycosyltransferase [Pseudomonadota bacterium]|nr:glycosyltransferase [Pseudomonadota bacterium]